MNLHHVSLPGGGTYLTPYTAISESVRSRARPWLDEMLVKSERRPLALPDLAYDIASAEAVVTRYAPTTRSRREYGTCS